MVAKLLTFFLFFILFLNHSYGVISSDQINSKDGHHIQISVCSLASYQNVATDTRDLLLKNFPNLEVSLVHYPIKRTNVIGSKVVRYIKVAGIALLLSGDYLFTIMGFPNPPNWFVKLSKKRFGMALGLWVVGNILQNNLIRTGAFEVYLDDEIIFSRLSEGNFPSLEDLTAIVGSKIGQTPLNPEID